MSEPITVHTSGAAARKESLASPRFAVVDGDPQADVATSTNPRGPRESITVVGIGEDGFDELGHKAQTALLRADVVIGSWRQLNHLPDTVRGERRPWPEPRIPALEGLFKSLTGLHVVVLSAGDPMFHGIGSTLTEVLGPDRITVIPAPSSVSLACARLGWPLERTPVASLTNRSLETLIPLIDSGVRFLVMGRDEFSATDIAGLLCEMGYDHHDLTVLSDLGSPDEEITAGTAAQPPRPVSTLNVIAVSPPISGQTHRRSLLPGLGEESYEHDGQLLDADIRALTVSALRPVPGQLLWDISGGTGSVAIEWLRAVGLASGGFTRTRAHAICFCPDPDSSARIKRNATRLGVPWLEVMGAAPRALKGARYAGGPNAVAPDAIYVGGGLGDELVVITAWSMLRPGGHMVINARTEEEAAELSTYQQRYGGTLRRVGISIDGTETEDITQWRAIKPLVPTGV